jgi:hypothetical protein
MLKKLFILLVFLSSLYAQNAIPKIFQSINNSDDDFVKKILLSKDRKQLLVISRETVDLLDAKSFKVINSLDFSGSAWDGDFAENGIVLLTHHDFTYYSKDGKTILFRIDRRDVGSFKAIDVPDQGYIVNMIKENGHHEQAFGFNQRVEGLMQLNLRTKKFISLPYEDQYNNKKYLNDIKDGVLRISNPNNEYTYIDIKTNKQLTLQDIKYTKINNHKILSSKNIIDDRYHSMPDLQRGCVTSDRKKYALIHGNSVEVYSHDLTHPIFTLSSTMNPFPPQSCLIYDDTLVVASKGIQHYDIQRDAALFSAIEKAKKIEPIIGTCHDDTFAISLWNGVSYGWDLQKGELLWYSKGPEVNRNHWEYASYKIRLNPKEKIADIQPYGQRDERHEVRINLLTGTEIPKSVNHTSPTTENWTTCDAGTGEVWLGKEYRFTYKDLDFYVLSDGEWLVHDAETGYFNTSSIKALGNLHIDNAPSNQVQIKQFYRPDIIKSILQNKQTPPEKNPAYTIPLKSSLVNIYSNNINQNLTQGTIDTKLSSYISQATLDELQSIFTQFKSLNSSEDYQKFYTALERNKNISLFKRFRKIKISHSKRIKEKKKKIVTVIGDFLENRMRHLNENPDEQNALIWSLSRLQLVDLVQNMIDNQTLTDASKQGIAVVLQEFDISTPYIFEIGKKELLYLRLDTFERLYEKYPDRTLELAFSIVENKTYKIKDYGYINAIKFLTKQRSKASPHVALNRIINYFNDTLSNPTFTSWEWPNLAAFYRAYAKPSDMKKLYTKLQTYLTINLKDDNWEKLKNRDFNSLLQQVLLDMNNYDSSFSKSLQMKILYSKLNKKTISDFLNLKDSDIAHETIAYMTEEYKKSGHKHPDLMRKFNYIQDPKILKAFINMHNTFDDCMKIENTTKMNLLRNLSVSDYTTLKCHDIPLGLVPSNKKEAYESFIQKK